MTLQVGGNTVVTSDRIVQLTNGTTASRPSSPSTGQLFYDTTLAKLIVWNGSAWKEAATSGSTSTPGGWSWGDDVLGSLGAGTNAVSRSSPTSIIGISDWIQVASGYNHALGVRANGTAWGWGRNDQFGVVGNNSGLVNRSSPVSIVGGFTDWIGVYGGTHFSAGIRANGTAWAWGRNNQGQLGNNDSGTGTTQSSPVSVVGDFTDWIQISAGGYHVTGLRANGQAWCWGQGAKGQLGNNSASNRFSPVSVAGGITDWIQVSGGKEHSAGVRASGTLWCWGTNYKGQIAVSGGAYFSRSSPVSVPGGFTDWIQVACGFEHTLAIRANGTLWAWGSNYVGGLGVNDQISRSSPVSVLGGFTDWVQVACGEHHSLGIRANGTLWGWGEGDRGRTALGTTYANRSSPTSTVGGITDWVLVAAGRKRGVGLRAQPKKI